MSQLVYSAEKKLPHKIQSESEIRKEKNKMSYEKLEPLCPCDEWADMW